MARKEQRTTESEGDGWQRFKTIALIVDAATRVLDLFWR
jgi:hypothetical protein